VTNRSVGGRVKPTITIQELEWFGWSRYPTIDH